MTRVVLDAAPFMEISMADFDNRAMMRGAATADAGIDQGLRSYMLGVYNLMVLGLAITGFAAFGLSRSPELFYQIFSNPILPWIVMLSPFAMVLVLSFGINRLSAGAARVIFLVYSLLMGISLSTIFFVYAEGDITRVFFITAASFGALSLWGYTTKRDLTGWGSFLIMGLFGIIIASIVNLFMGWETMNFVISVIGVGVFAGLTAYDTQKIKEMYYAGDDGEMAAKKSVMGALALYLDFINLFIMLLRLLGNRE